MTGQWQLLSSLPGGTVAAVAVASLSDGRSRLFAGTRIGLRTSADGGASWTRALGPLAGAAVEAILVSPLFGDDQSLFVGADSGLYRSEDTGETWRHLLAGSPVLAIAAAKTEGGDLLLLAATRDDGVLRSEDRGISWASANPGLLEQTVIGLAFSPCFDRDRTVFAATPHGVFRSRNGALAWREVDILADDATIECLAISPAFADDRMLVVGTADRGLLLSRNGGASWTQAHGLDDDAITAVSIDTAADGSVRMIVAIERRLAVSTDRGVSWTAIPDAKGPALSLTVDDRERKPRLLAGLGAHGVQGARLAGGRWEDLSRALRGNLAVSLLVSPSFSTDNTVFLGGLETGLLLSPDGGVTWNHAGGSLESAPILEMASTPGNPAGACTFARTDSAVFRVDLQTGDGQRLTDPGHHGAPLAIAAQGGSQHPDRLLACFEDGAILASNPVGARWTRVGSTGPIGTVLSTAAVSGHGNALFAVARARESSVPVLWRSTDAGNTWQRWLVQDEAASLPIGVATKSDGSYALFAVAGAHVLTPIQNASERVGSERRPLWTRAPLPDPSVVGLEVVPSPGFASDQTVFVATTAGAFVSRDGGVSFAALGAGLEAGPILALRPSPSYRTDRIVFALGLGGAIWRLRDE